MPLLINWPNFSDQLNHLGVGIYNANILEEDEKEKGKKKKGAAQATTEPCQTIVIHVTAGNPAPQNMSRSIRCCLNVYI